MAAYPSEEQPYRDTIKVPAVLQMPGDPFPTEFYARYPEAFRVPVRLAWREPASPPSDAPSRPVVTDVAARQEAAADVFAGAVPEAADEARVAAAPAVGAACISSKAAVESDFLDPHTNYIIARLGLPRSDLAELLARSEPGSESSATGKTIRVTGLPRYILTFGTQSHPPAALSR